MAAQTQDRMYKELLDQILGATAVTPGRFMKPSEAMDPVLRQLLLERLGWSRKPTGMLPLPPQR